MTTAIFVEDSWKPQVTPRRRAYRVIKPNRRRALELLASWLAIFLLLVGFDMTRTPTMTRIALAGFLLIVAVPATAEPAALGCFTRTYDRAHLARHPDQIVTAVKLRIYRPPPESGAKYWFLAQFTLRGQDETLRTSGLCEELSGAVLPPRRRRAPADAVHCFVECDGGGVDVVPRARDAMMYLDRIRVAACGEDYVDGGGQEVTGGKDDRVFRLDRVEGASCAGMKP